MYQICLNRKHLVDKNLSGRLHQSFQFVINAVNKMLNNALYNMLIEQLCEEVRYQHQHDQKVCQRRFRVIG